MNSCEMILAGFGGQGILFAGKMLAYAAMLRNRHLSWLPSYGPEMRGGTANCHVIISDDPVGSPIILKPDIMVAMNRPSLDKFEDEVVPGGMIFVDSSLIDRRVKRTDVEAVYINATETADKAGRKTLANMVMLGAVIEKTGLFSTDEMKETIIKSIPAKKAALAAPNIEAVEMGAEYIRKNK
ncbi:MAG: 2-oxoacid:acceptor oxidoreductase family protein [bacterium]|nr:2-oxoacid:acceptor oxidoreductase family protein [bacterium]